MTRLILSVLMLAIAACGQVSVYGTSGAVSSKYWENATLSFGAGGAYSTGRVEIGAEVWRSEVNRHRDPLLNGDRRAEAVLGLVRYRVWRGLGVEGGGGIQRITDTAFGPLIEGTWRYQRGVASVGGYYQVGTRMWARVGYRRLILKGDHDTSQAYTSVGFTF